MPLIRLPEALRRYCGGAVSLEVDGATVGEALEELCRRHPEARLRLFDESGMTHAHLALFCNETHVRREDATGVPLPRRDTITLLEAVGGSAAWRAGGSQPVGRRHETCPAPGAGGGI